MMVYLFLIELEFNCDLCHEFIIEMNFEHIILKKKTEQKTEKNIAG